MSFWESKTGQPNENGYFFLTQNDGISTAKSPRGMFEDKHIDNDLLWLLIK
jgi:hypothetical protein